MLLVEFVRYLWLLKIPQKLIQKIKVHISPPSVKQAKTKHKLSANKDVQTVKILPRP